MLCCIEALGLCQAVENAYAVSVCSAHWKEGNVTELVLWSIMCQSCNSGAGRWQKSVTTVHRVAHSLWRACSPLLTPHLVSASPVHPGHTKANVLHRTQSSSLLDHRFLHLSYGGKSLPRAIPGSHQHSPMPLAPGWALPKVCSAAGPPLLGLAACCSAVPCSSPRAWVTGQFLTLCLSQGIRAEAHDF